MSYGAYKCVQEKQYRFMDHHTKISSQSFMSSYWKSKKKYTFNKGKGFLFSVLIEKKMEKTVKHTLSPNA